MINSSGTQVATDKSGNSSTVAPVPMGIFAELLGGRPIRDVQDELLKSGRSDIFDSLLPAAESVSLSKEDYFFSEDEEGRFCTEVLFLKTVLFLKFTRLIKKIYSATSLPFLTLNPEELQVLIPLTDFFPVPARWGFNISEIKTPSSLKVEAPSPINLFQPAGEVDGFYTAPEITALPFASETVADFVITEISRDEDEPSMVSLTMKLSGEKLRYPDYSEGDIAQLLLKCNDTEINELTFWGCVLEKPVKSFDLISTLHDPEHKVENILEKRVGSTFFETKVILYKRFSAAWDIYTLGKFFLRTLLVNDQTPPSLLDKRLSTVVSLLDDSFMETPNDIASIENRLLSKLAESENIFSKKGILYCHSERVKKENKVPDEVWSEIMLLCFRLLTNIDGFSLSPRRGVDKGQIESAYDTLITQLEEIASVLKVDLFSNRAQSREILEALGEVQGAG